MASDDGHSFAGELVAGIDKDSLRREGIKAFDDCRFEESVALFTREITLWHGEKTLPKYQLSFVLSNRSLAFIKLGRWQKAFDDADLAVTYHPG